MSGAGLRRRARVTRGAKVARIGDDSYNGLIMAAMVKDGRITEMMLRNGSGIVRIVAVPGPCSAMML